MSPNLFTINKFDKTNYLIIKIIQFLQISCKIYFYVWLKGFSEVEENEIANHLTKLAVTDTELPNTFLLFPAFSMIREIKQNMFRCMR